MNSDKGSSSGIPLSNEWEASMAAGRTGQVRLCVHCLLWSRMQQWALPISSSPSRIVPKHHAELSRIYTMEMPRNRASTCPKIVMSNHIKARSYRLQIRTRVVREEPINNFQAREPSRRRIRCRHPEVPGEQTNCLKAARKVTRELRRTLTTKRMQSRRQDTHNRESIMESTSKHRAA